jgi:uncharacterized protein (TIGR02996 family)
LIGHDRFVVTLRFERDDSGVRRFWEIELDGVHLITRKGRGEGGLIDAKRRTFASAELATAEAERRILDRRRAGWRDAAGSPTYPSRNHRLEAAIVDDLDDVAAWTVYADWLQARGDRFGEWLALSLAGSLPDADPRAGGLWSTDLNWVVERIDLDAFALLEHRHGFVVRAWIGEPAEGYRNRSPERLLDALLRSPNSWLLRSLTLASRRAPALSSVLLGHRDSIMLEHLRELVLGEADADDEPMRSLVTIGDLARVLRVCPSLETFHVRGTRIQFSAAIEHPRLVGLTLEAVDLHGEVVEAVARASLPALRRLELWLGHTDRFHDAPTIANLHPLFDDDRLLPGLRELALINCDFADAIAEALAHSNRLARLEHVDLSNGTLAERGARAILEHAAAFRRLRSLDLHGNYLSPELALALEEALPGVVKIGEQIDPAVGREGRYRGYYVAVGE